MKAKISVKFLFTVLKDDMDQNSKIVTPDEIVRLP